MEENQEQSVEELWENYFADRSDIKAKNAVLTRYLYLVIGVVKRMMPQFGDLGGKGCCDRDDLINSGVLGLIDAVDKFDRAFNVKFQTYATIRIRGEILDYLRRQDWASTELRRKINSIQSATEILEARLHRQPSEGEIARELGISEHDVTAVLQQSQMFNVVNFETMVYEREAGQMGPASRCDPSRIVEDREMNDTLRRVISDLPEKERMVIVLHYYEGLTMKSIAKILGVSESRVSQIHSRTLLKMRRAIGSN